MEKIQFKDLPNTDTPINATNLNAIQDNAEAMIKNAQNNSTTDTYSCDYLNPKVLYANNTGAGSGNIQTSDSPLNYSKIVLTIREGSTWFWEYTFHPKYQATNLAINPIQIGGGWSAVYAMKFDINSSGLTITQNKIGELGKTTLSDTTDLKIIRVIGYK